MSLLHVFGVEIGNQWQDLGHVLQSVIEGLEGLVALDFLIVVGVGLSSLHVSGLLDETISVNLVP
jgi:hypothetical protein